jgi:DNA-binding SARP family transcriptional activator
MFHSEANPAGMYLPLLTNPQPDVRQQACTILLSTYGEHALTYLRRLLDDPNPELRDQVRTALQTVSEITGLPAKAEPFAGIYVECLGRLRVYADNREVRSEEWREHEVAHAGWQRVQACFAYLVHSGRRGATRAALSKAVGDTSGRASSFSRMIGALERMLASMFGADFVERALLIGQDHYVLLPDYYHTDVQLFERAYNLAAHTEETNDLATAQPIYMQALQVYGGPYMVDIPRSGHWCQSRRDYLIGSFVIATERVAEYLFRQREYEKCVSVCSQALNVEDDADDLVVWLLRAYSQLGLSGELEHTYHHYLRAAAIEPHTREGRQDRVVQTYQKLNRMRSLGE